MCCCLNRALPFCLALVMGIVLAHFAGPERSDKQVLRSSVRPVVVPLQIDSVPGFIPDPPGASGGGHGSLRLIALFDSDGWVKEVRPYPMLPYGVPESEAGRGKFSDYTPMMMGTRFVKPIPNVTEAAMEQVRGIRFTPKSISGRAVSEWVMVNVGVGLHGCGSAQMNVEVMYPLTIVLMDDNGTLWHGVSSPERDGDCFRIRVVN